MQVGLLAEPSILYIETSCFNLGSNRKDWIGAQSHAMNHESCSSQGLQCKAFNTPVDSTTTAEARSSSVPPTSHVPCAVFGCYKTCFRMSVCLAFHDAWRDFTGWRDMYSLLAAKAHCTRLLHSQWHGGGGGGGST